MRRRIRPGPLFQALEQVWRDLPPLPPEALDAFCETLLCLAASDGRIEPIEVETLRRVVEITTGRPCPPAEALRRVNASLEEIRRTGYATTARAAIERVGRHEGTPEGRAMLLFFDALVIVDGEFGEGETALLEEIRAALGGE